MIDLYTSGAAHQNTALHAIASGIDDNACMKPVSAIGRPTGASICVCWGTRYLDRLKQQYRKVVVVERGYYNDRSLFYSLGVGGLNNRADFANFNMPSDRWDKYGSPMQPWKKDGDYYLIMGQVPGDMSINGVDIDAFYSAMANELIDKTDKPVYFRPHPLARQRSTALPVMLGLLSDALAGAAGVVTYNSNSGVDAILAGVPTMVGDIGSMAWPIAAKSIDQLLEFTYPGRVQWAYNLAYTQWTLQELIDGTAWGHLCRHDCKKETAAKQAAQQPSQSLSPM